jgi:CrcB protein
MKQLVGVVLAGAAGAVARYGIGIWANPDVPGDFPWGTLAINLSGCLLLGWLLAYASGRAGFEFWRETLGTGFIGAFTTFSAFSIETLAMLRHGREAGAVLYVVTSMVGGFLLAAAGFRLGQRNDG